MQDIYIKPTLGISCVIAESEGHIVGFQSLEWSDPECVGADRIGTDWAFIASFVAPDNHDKGIGKRLFEHTKQRALFASVNTIDATIGAVNDSGLRYYTRLGFIDHDRINASPLSDGTLIDRIRKKNAPASRTIAEIFGMLPSRNSRVQKDGFYANALPVIR
jgi:ribosomal protein S18 acetylase RimI-like enzyme